MDICVETLAADIAATGYLVVILPHLGMCTMFVPRIHVSEFGVGSHDASFRRRSVVRHSDHLCEFTRNARNDRIRNHLC